MSSQPTSNNVAMDRASVAGIAREHGSAVPPAREIGAIDSLSRVDSDGGTSRAPKRAAVRSIDPRQPKGESDEKIHGVVHGFGGRVREDDEELHAGAAEEGDGGLGEVDGRQQGVPG